MVRIATTLAALVLVLHGLVHLMGTAVYLRWAEIQGLPYKTTLMGGHWSVGERGMLVFGASWGLAALGFVGVAVGWWAGWDAWRGALLAVTLVSLVLTALDWSTAYAGVMVNLAILAALWLGPRLAAGADRGRSRL